MAITLDNLSAQEIRLLNAAISINGTMEALNQELIQNGTFDKYRQLHRQYLKLWQNSNSEEIKMEALKRLIFLNWYSITEPGCFTGIGELDDKAVTESYKILDQYLSDKKLDGEFTWMLSYYSSFDFVILPFIGNLQNLIAFIESVDKSMLHVSDSKVVSETMENRGQMGIYWKSIGQSK